MHVRRVYLGLVLLLFPSLAPAMAATVERVSVGSDGAQANDWCSLPCISADGRYVAFASWASNLVSGDSNGYADVFVHDRLTAETTRVSVASDGAEANDDSLAPAISADGRYVAFYSYASDPRARRHQWRAGHLRARPRDRGDSTCERRKRWRSSRRREC